jgi:hypothetical protein
MKYTLLYGFQCRETRWRRNSIFLRRYLTHDLRLLTFDFLFVLLIALALRGQSPVFLPVSLPQWFLSLL